MRDLRPRRAKLPQKSVRVLVLLVAHQALVRGQLRRPPDLVQAERGADAAVPFGVPVDVVHDGHRRPEDRLRRGRVRDRFPVEAGAPVRLDVRVRAGAVLGNLLEQRDGPRVGWFLFGLERLQVWKGGGIESLLMPCL